MSINNNSSTPLSEKVQLAFVVGITVVTVAFIAAVAFVAANV